jgi:hypothetical protein
MSKLTEQLRSRGIHNSYDFYEQEPWISWTANGGRSVLPAWWAVYKRGRNLGSAWYDHGAKTFSGRKRDKEVLAEAQRWASVEFGGIKEWARDPFGSYGDAGFIKKRITEILAMPAKQMA